MNKKYDGIEFFDFVDLQKDDLLKILAWRNHKDVRKWMKNTNVISKAEHFEFVNNLSGDTSRKYWYVKCKKKPTSVVYLNNLHKNEAEWGIYLAPNKIGSGLGLEICYYSMKLFFEELGLDKIHGYVKRTNHENIKLQKMISFKINSKDDEFIHFTLNKERYIFKYPDNFKKFRKQIVYGR
jgi:UDP-4-amino-4,6-dideoxy-N-acetyl-beta-L-altrosamine N-acetyltransferase